MIGPSAAATDEAFFDLLADCDEALANGTEAEPTRHRDETPDWQPRLEKGLDCLRQLQRLRPARDHKHCLGRFEIQRELGRGGFGVVFLAHDPRLNRSVALKVPRSEFLADEKLRARF